MMMQQQLAIIIKSSRNVSSSDVTANILINKAKAQIFRSELAVYSFKLAKLSVLAS